MEIAEIAQFSGALKSLLQPRICMSSQRPSESRRRFLKSGALLSGKRPAGSWDSISRAARIDERKRLELMAYNRATATGIAGKKGGSNKEVSLKESYLSPKPEFKKKRFRFLSRRLTEEKKLANEFYRHKKKRPAFSLEKFSVKNK